MHRPVLGVVLSSALAAYLFAFAEAGTPVPANAETEATWGDLNCEASPNPVDALGLLRYDAGQNFDTNSCPDLGDTVDASPGGRWQWGDIDCSATINPVDGLKLLRFDAGLSVAKVDPECPDVGDVVSIEPVTTLEELLPEEVGGETLERQTFTGTALATGDDAWEEYADALGIPVSALELATAHFSPESGTVFTAFTAHAIQAAGSPWAPRLQVFFAAAQANATLHAEQITLSGEQVVRLLGGGDGQTYYYASGDVLFVISTQEESLAEEALTAMPGAETTAGVAAQGDPVPGSGPLLMPEIQRPREPVCVAEPPGRQQLSYLTLDAAYAMPVPTIVSAPSITSGELTPTIGTGPAAIFHYEATFFGQDEQIELLAQSYTGGVGTATVSFPVQHCLNGQWQDGSRVLQVNHTGQQITANIAVGSLSCGEVGVAYSGVLASDSASFSGNDLKVCNPEECVQAGHLPLTELRPYTATIQPDGQAIDFEWEERFFDLVYDDENNLVACPEVSTSTDFYSNPRITFGPGFP